MPFVYITTNLITGKKYLGKHNGKNSNYIGSGTLLKKAIKKYGKENFSIEIVEECETDEEAYEIEKKLSLDWKIVESDEWYNMKFGGEGFLSGELHPMFGIPKSEEHKQKLSKINLNKKLSDETKAKISLKAKGIKNPCFGLFKEQHPAYNHKKTDECKQIISEKMRGRVKTVEQIEKFKKSRVGKGMGKHNSMSNLENRKKVSESKLGRKRIYREDGSFYMSKKTNIEG